MLKVNLLDYRYKKMKLFIQFETLGMILLLIMICCFLYLVIDKMSLDKEALQTEIASQTAQLEMLSGKTKKVTELENLTKRVNQILTDIERLKKNLDDSSRFYDEVRKRVPFSVWLTQTKEEKDMLVLTGIAESQSAIADFMTNLEEYNKFDGILLVESVRESINKRDFYRYTVQAKYKVEKPEPKNEP